MKYIIKADNRRWNNKIWAAPTSERQHACLPRFDFDEFDTEEDAVNALVKSVEDWLYDDAWNACENMPIETEEEHSAFEKAMDAEFDRLVEEIKTRAGWDYDGIYYSVREAVDDE